MCLFLHWCANFMKIFEFLTQFFLQFSTAVTVFFQMEDLDKHLMIVKIEVSCWKEQLKQAVSPLQFITISYSSQSILIQSQVYHSNNYVSHYIPLFYYFDAFTDQYHSTSGRSEESSSKSSSTTNFP